MEFGKDCAGRRGGKPATLSGILQVVPPVWQGAMLESSNNHLDVVYGLRNTHAAASTAPAHLNRSR